jgi:hypothetical protein
MSATPYSGWAVLRTLRSAAADGTFVRRRKASPKTKKKGVKPKPERTEPETFELSAYEMAAAEALVSHCGDEGSCFLSYDTLGVEGRMHRQRAMEAAQRLADAGFLILGTMPTSGGGSCTTFTWTQKSQVEVTRAPVRVSRRVKASAPAPDGRQERPSVDGRQERPSPRPMVDSNDHRSVDEGQDGRRGRPSGGAMVDRSDQPMVAGSDPKCPEGNATSGAGGQEGGGEEQIRIRSEILLSGSEGEGEDDPWAHQCLRQIAADRELCLRFDGLELDKIGRAVLDDLDLERRPSPPSRRQVERRVDARIQDALRARQAHRANGAA